LGEQHIASIDRPVFLWLHQCRNNAAVREAVDLYAKDNGGALPSEEDPDEKKILLEGGYLEEWPLVPTFAFTEPVQKEIRYFDNFADMDDSGAVEDVIIVQNLKTEVCQDFVRRYASPGFGENIYDYEAEGEKYPGQTIGRHVKIFAINWSVSSVRDICDILWVIRYTKFPDE
jgi:hypothetical protein